MRIFLAAASEVGEARVWRSCARFVGFHPNRHLGTPEFPSCSAEHQPGHVWHHRPVQAAWCSDRDRWLPKEQDRQDSEPLLRKENWQVCRIPTSIHLTLLFSLGFTNKRSLFANRPCAQCCAITDLLCVLYGPFEVC